MFGRLAGTAAADFARKHAQVAGGAASLAADDRRIEGLMASEGTEGTERIRQELKKFMWEKVGIYRNEPDMTLAVGAVNDLERRYGNARRSLFDGLPLSPRTRKISLPCMSVNATFPPHRDPRIDGSESRSSVAH